MRNIILAANWKMNKSKKEILDYGEQFFKDSIKELPDWVKVVFAPSFLSLEYTKELFSKRGFITAAQDMSFEDKGAFTGQVSSSMLKAIGIDHTLIGHSECRRYLGDDDLRVSKKVEKAFKEKITPIVCVGENLEQRQSNKTKEVIKAQLLSFSKFIDSKNIIIAYEPIWAIGTGLNATKEQAEEIHGFIREFLKEHVSKNLSEQISIIYGGSVSAENCHEFFAKENIDGVLVGGASLDPAVFGKIVSSGIEVKKLINFKP